MRRTLSLLNSSSALRCSSTKRVRLLSSSSHLGTIVSVDSIRDNVSKFIITSNTTDPFLNLAIEDHLLRTSDHDTHILFTYVNRPCVVIGRNQNPWAEVNIAALNDGALDASDATGNARQRVLLVRRRSGGGTVFHDEGNINYSFIVPNDKAFNRNKHAEIVVQAIQNISSQLAFTGEQLLPSVLKKGIRVNDRHDIVMPARSGTGVDEGRMVKMSGSAYKLTRGRALHHGTLLFSSPNLESIGSYLRSPAMGFIDAKGVGSVRSPVGNLRFSHNPLIRERLSGEIQKSIADVFQSHYTEGWTHHSSVSEADTRDPSMIKAGLAELKSPEWKYLQTPSFTFTTHQLAGSTFEPSPWPPSLPPSVKVILKAKHGIIIESHISFSADQDIADAEAQQVRAVLQGKRLDQIRAWKGVFAGLDRWVHPSTGTLQAWLSDMFPPVPI